MTAKDKIKNAIIVVCVIIALLSVSQCRREQKQAASNIKTLTDSITYVKNKNGSLTAEIGTLQINKKDLYSVILDQDAELKELADKFSKVNTVVKFKTLTKFDTITIHYPDSIYIANEFNIEGSVKDKWRSFNYEASNEAFKITDFEIPNEYSVITGKKRKWFLGAETMKTDITSLNPYVKVTEAQSIEVPVSVPIQKKWYVWLIIGAAGGVLIAK